MYCLDMLTIAVELGQENPAYQDLATKFFEHFVYIGAAVNKLGDERPGFGMSRKASTATRSSCPTDGAFRSRRIPSPA